MSDKMYLRTPKSTAKQIKYKDSDSDDEFEIKTPKGPKVKPEKVEAATPKRKANQSNSDDGVPVKKEKKIPTLPRISTDLEQVYGNLDKAEKISDKSRTKWEDEEHGLILLGLWKRMDPATIAKLWPQDEYPRSPAVIKKKVNDLKLALAESLNVKVSADPEIVGK
jgi:hypothetical protein